jgi:hypothetical protein
MCSSIVDVLSLRERQCVDHVSETTDDIITELQKRMRRASFYDDPTLEHNNDV